MEEKIDFNKILAERLMSGIVGAVVIAFGSIIIGTALIPAVLAYFFNWKWLAVYPSALAICTLFAGRKKP